MNQNQKIKVERDTYEKNGKTYFSYFIRGNVRGKDVRAAVIPPDRGGYTVLDIVFGDAMEAELVVTPFEMKDGFMIKQGDIYYNYTFEAVVSAAKVDLVREVAANLFK